MNRDRDWQVLLTATLVLAALLVLAIVVAVVDPR
jgi:hypothetical protein